MHADDQLADRAVGAALSLIAANFYGRPAGKLQLVGVTGTSGKTTTTKMIESIFDAAGEPVGLIGTIEYRAGDERLVADRTTPDAVMLHQWFAKMVAAYGKQRTVEMMELAGDYWVVGTMMNAGDQHLPVTRPAMMPPLARDGRRVN